MTNDNSKQLCTIKIAFTVDNDDTAFCVKKLLTEALKDVPDNHFTFTLMPLQSALQVEKAKYDMINSTSQTPPEKTKQE